LHNDAKICATAWITNYRNEIAHLNLAHTFLP
jgi:hypothetical protein